MQARPPRPAGLVVVECKRDPGWGLLESPQPVMPRFPARRGPARGRLCWAGPVGACAG
jgi:hypothetical protein